MNPKKSVMLLSVFMALLFIVSFFLILNLQYGPVFIDQSQEKLQMLATEKGLQVNNFLEFKVDELNILRSIRVLKEAFISPTDEVKLKAAVGRINDIKATVPGISLLTPEGIVIVGDIDLPGTNYSAHPYFQNRVWNVSFARYYDPLRKGDYFAVIGPVYDQNNASTLLGLLAFDVPLEDISSMFEGGNRGKTGEIYIIDKEGMLLSASRFVGQGNRNGVLLQGVDSEGAAQCLNDTSAQSETHEEGVTPYKDYLGHTVIGAHAYVPELNGCVIAEIDYDEAYSGIYGMFEYSLVVLALLVAVVLGSGYLVARKVGPAARPLLGKRKERSRIGKTLSRVHWAWFAAAGLAVSACICVMVADLDLWIFLAQAGALIVSAAILGRSFRIANRKSGRFLGLAAASFFLCEFVTMLFQPSALGEGIANPSAALLLLFLIPGFSLLLLGAPLLFLALKEAVK